MSQCTWSPHHWVCDEEEVSRKEQKEAQEVSSTIEDGGGRRGAMAWEEPQSSVQEPGASPPPLRPPC